MATVRFSPFYLLFFSFIEHLIFVLTVTKREDLGLAVVCAPRTSTDTGVVMVWLAQKRNVGE